MANLVERQILLDAPRNMVVKWAGTLDTSNATLTPALALSDAVYNNPQLRLAGFRLNKVQWSMTDQLGMTLAWQATTPQLMAPLAGRGKLCAYNYGGYTPDQARAGYNGAINLSTTGWASGVQNFTVTLELIKLYGFR